MKRLSRKAPPVIVKVEDSVMVDSRRIRYNFHTNESIPLFGIAWICVTSALAFDVYVAPDGSDDNKGTLKKPVATIQKALEIVRENRSAKADSIVLRNGTYNLEQTIRLGFSDSGTPDAPFSIKAYKDEKPIVAGSRVVSGTWEAAPTKGQYMISLKEDPILSGGFSQLFVNGKRQILARFPNGNPVLPEDKKYATLSGADERTYIGSRDSGIPPLPHEEVYFSGKGYSKKRWSRPSEAILHVFPTTNFCMIQFRIRGVDYSKSALLLAEGGYQKHEMYRKYPGTKIDKGSRYFVENVREELDSPGEWYYDKREQTLYYQPADGVDLNNAKVEATHLRQLISISATRDQPVHDVQINGIRFTQTEPVYLEPHTLLSFADWVSVRYGALTLEGVKDCDIENCFFDAPGGHGIVLNHYAENINIKNNLFTECGGSAVQVTGKSRLNRKRSYTCPFCGNKHEWGFDPINKLYPENCAIENNRIHDIGIYGKHSPGILISMAVKTRVRNNHIFNTPGAAICIHDGMYGGHRIEHNEIHHNCRETDTEGGALVAYGRDSWWCHNQAHGFNNLEALKSKRSQPPVPTGNDAKYTTRIAHNRIRGEDGLGVYLGGGTANYIFENNLVEGSAMYLREGTKRKIRNNIFVHAKDPPMFRVGYEENQDEFIHNIIYTRTWIEVVYERRKRVEKLRGGSSIGFAYPPKNGPWIGKMDFNNYFTERETFIARTGLWDFKEWKKKGLDEHSVYTDPMFVDLAGFDYNLQDEAPALELGFKPFPLDGFGTKDFPEKWKEEEPNFPSSLRKAEAVKSTEKTEADED